MNEQDPLSDYWIKNLLSIQGNALFYKQGNLECVIRKSYEFYDLYFNISDDYGGIKTAKLHLKITYSEITVVDLLVPESYRNEGYGSALFYLGIQLIKCLFEDGVAGVKVKGVIPVDGASIKRERFWKRFGVSVDEEEYLHRKDMNISLEKLLEFNLDDNPYKVNIHNFKSQFNINSQYDDLVLEAKKFLPTLKALLKDIEDNERRNQLNNNRFILFRSKNIYSLGIIYTYEYRFPRLREHITEFLSLTVFDIDKKKLREVIGAGSLHMKYRHNVDISEYLSYLRLYLDRYEILDNPKMMYRKNSPVFGHDFMLGDLDKLYYRKVDNLHAQIGADCLLQHINRVLKKIPGNILRVIETSSTVDNLSVLLNKIADKISLVELYRPKFCSEGLYIKIYLEEGILDIMTSWTAWKSLRASEIFDDLSPVFKKPIREKTYILFDNERLPLPDNDELMVIQILDLEGHNCYEQKSIMGMIPHVHELNS